MLACTLGCDHLFELGFVWVGPGGGIARGDVGEVTPDRPQPRPS